MEEVEVGKVVQTLLGTYPRTQPVDVKFSSLDIQYLQRKTELSHRLVARMLRIFGEAVVLESLRRFATGWQYEPRSKEALFVSICRAVESMATIEAGGESTSAASARSGGPQSPPASQSEEM